MRLSEAYHHSRGLMSSHSLGHSISYSYTNITQPEDSKRGHLRRTWEHPKWPVTQTKTWHWPQWSLLCRRSFWFWFMINLFSFCFLQTLAANNYCCQPSSYIPDPREFHTFIKWTNRVFFWGIAVKIPSKKTHSGKSNLRLPGKILYLVYEQNDQIFRPNNAMLEWVQCSVYRVVYSFLSVIDNLNANLMTANK